MKRNIFVLMSMIMIVCITACSPAATPIAYATREPNVIAEEPQVSYPTAVPEHEEAEPYTAPTVAVQAPNSGMDNYFQDYGVNPMTDAEDDNLSTFALDVDTASYEITTSYINNGEIPPMDAVRAEEFINAFDQGYSAPEDNAFTIYADGGPSPFIEDGNYLVRIGVQGYRVPDDERKPLNLTFVIDVSGSMSTDNRLELVKDSLELLVENLDERDSVTIVAYSDDAELILKPTSATETRRIKRAISRLHPTNSTNVDAGLQMGYRYALRNLDENAVNRLILCSDGVANQGNTDADTILNYVKGYVENGITLTGIGVGMGNFNDVLLEQLADGGDGNYYYVDTTEQAHEVFVENLTSTMQVIAYDAKIQIDFNPDVVASYRLIGYENREVADEDFRDDDVDAGEIGAGMTATALYEIELVDGEDGRIATVQLRWQDADTDEVSEIDGNIYTEDLADDFEDTSPYFQLASTVAAYAEILRVSPYVEGDLDDVSDEARRIKRLFRENEQVCEFADLAERTARLDR